MAPGSHTALYLFGCKRRARSAACVNTDMVARTPTVDTWCPWTKRGSCQQTALTDEWTYPLLLLPCFLSTSHIFHPSPLSPDPSQSHLGPSDCMMDDWEPSYDPTHTLAPSIRLFALYRHGNWDFTFTSRHRQHSHHDCALNSDLLGFGLTTVNAGIMTLD